MPLKWPKQNFRYNKNDTNPFTDKIRERKETKIFYLTKEKLRKNYQKIKEEIKNFRK